MLLSQSWTDEEYRHFEQMYMRKVEETERITAMLDRIRAHVGPVNSPSIVLNGIPQAAQEIPTLCYDQQGACGMVFVATLFEHREIAGRFEACRRQLTDIAASSAPWAGSDPAFEIIRHLNNNWWGRKPTVNAAHPNDFANALMAEFPFEWAQYKPAKEWQ